MEQLFAFMFVDIVESTQLFERVGDAAASAVTQNLLDYIRQVVAAHGGAVVKSLGDGLLATFPAADAALESAKLLMDGRNQFDLDIRIGCHYGPAVIGAGDIFGDAVNVAARVEQIARPGEILVTETLVQHLSEAHQNHTRLLNNVAVKGKAEPIKIFRVPHHDEAEDSVESTVIGAHSNFRPDAGVLTLHLTYQGESFKLNRFFPKLTVGRDEACDVRVASRQTSRQHAMLEFGRESFILKDHSTNGSFVRAGNSPPIILKRDQTKLVGSGLIGFGADPESPSQDHVASFRFELS